METTLSALPINETPSWRVSYKPDACSLLELIAALIGGNKPLEIAQSLLKQFGSLESLTKATIHEISEVRGIGNARAAGLKAAVEIGRRVLSLPDSHPPRLNTPDEAAGVVQLKMQTLEQEHLFVMPLNTRNELIGEPVEVYKGSLNSSMIRVAEIFRPAIRANAAAIIVAHNHPSGDPTPSPEDVAVTRSIVEAGKLMDIEVLDHIVIGRNRFVSLKSKRLGFNGD